MHQVPLLHHVDEFLGPDQAQEGMLPAQQGLDGDQGAAGDGDDGLVVEPELAQLQGAPQLVFDLEAAPRGLSHLRTVEGEPRPPGLLGPLEGHFRLAQQAAGDRIVLGIEGDAEASGEAQIGQSVQVQGPVDQFPQSVGSRGGLVPGWWGPGPGGQGPGEDETVAGEARQNVPRRGAGGEPLPEDTQGLVPHQVAMAGHQVLKAIQVEHQQGQVGGWRLGSPGHVGPSPGPCLIRRVPRLRPRGRRGSEVRRAGGREGIREADRPDRRPGRRFAQGGEQ